MKSKILTLQNLIHFCQSQQMNEFNAYEQNNGNPIVVQVPDVAELVFDNQEQHLDGEGMIFPKIRVCHTLLNRNGSFISEKNMKKAMPTIKYRPILATIHQLNDGTWDFHSHDMHIETNDDGNEEMIYDENQVGCFTADEPYLEYDKEMDKTYVVAKGAIPEEYSRAASIIRSKNNTTKVSCELCIYVMSFQFNGKEKYLEIEDFRFNGCTCLGSEKDGTPIGEGMIGSKLTLEDFSVENNSIFSNKSGKFEKQLVKMQEKLNSSISHFDINKETKRKEDSQLDDSVKIIEEASKTSMYLENNEMGKEVESVFSNDSNNMESVQCPNNVQDSKIVAENNFEKSITRSLNENGDMSVFFSISHEDIKFALYNLLVPYEEEDNRYYIITSVYDDYFIYEDFWARKPIYGQKYVVDGDNVSFKGNRYVLHKEYLTDEELSELNAMRSNYAELKKFKQDTEDAILKENREKILSQEKYSVISNKKDGKYVNEAFARLVNEMNQYSPEDLEKEAKVILADYYTNFEGSLTKETQSVVTGKKLFASTNNRVKKKYSRYGNLFAKEEC